MGSHSGSRQHRKTQPQPTPHTYRDTEARRGTGSPGYLGVGAALGEDPGLCCQEALPPFLLHPNCVPRSQGGRQAHSLAGHQGLSHYTPPFQGPASPSPKARVTDLELGAPGVPALSAPCIDLALSPQPAQEATKMPKSEGLGQARRGSVPAQGHSTFTWCRLGGQLRPLGQAPGHPGARGRMGKGTQLCSQSLY